MFRLESDKAAVQREVYPGQASHSGLNFEFSPTILRGQ
jgi:hypothetical protein